MKIKNLFILLILAACKPSEIKKVFYTFPNGQVGEVRHYPNPSDTLSYRKEVFYNNGAKGYIGDVSNGRKTGKWTWWYPNGNKKDECTFKDGFYTDTVFHWYESGRLKQIEIVAGQGVREDSCCNCNGIVIEYHENGGMKEKVQRLNNLRQDTAKSWYDNGQLEYWAFFKNGEEHGVSEWYYRNGERMSKGFFLNGKLDGDVYHWDSLGRVTFITTYRNGELVDER